MAQQTGGCRFYQVKHLFKALLTRGVIGVWHFGRSAIGSEFEKQTKMATEIPRTACSQLTKVGGIHCQNIIKALEVIGLNRARTQMFQRIAATGSGCTRARVRQFADMPVTGTGRVHMDIVHALLFEQVLKHAVRRWRTADIAQANEQYAS